MKVQVRYRFDAHKYTGRGCCEPSCTACPREQVEYPSYEDALAAQPLEERQLEDGDQYGLELPPRRFQIVVSSYV